MKNEEPANVSPQATIGKDKHSNELTTSAAAKTTAMSKDSFQNQ